MQHFTAHRLAVLAEAQSTIELNEHQGSAIRGSLYHALRGHFCVNREAVECAACPLVATCPVATLVSMLDPDPRHRHGRYASRPLTIQPPLPGRGGTAVQTERGVFYHYYPGDRLAFGMTIYSDALSLFPYVILSLHNLQRGGIGRRVEQHDGRMRRGTFTILQIEAENPLTGERHLIHNPGDRMVRMPDIPVTHEQVLAQPVPRGPVTLEFLTPTRLVRGGKLVKPHQFTFRVFFQRLIERLERLSRLFCDTPLELEDREELLALADRVEIVERDLCWEEVRSYSTRRRGASPISGLMGSVTLQAEDWAPFWPWVLWGQFTHVGKDAVKGNGWYVVHCEYGSCGGVLCPSSDI